MREKTGLGNLHPELLSMVIDLAAQDALRPFPALNLVNHHFNNVANNLVRRKFELDFTPGEKLLSTWKLMDRMLEDRLMLRNIRSLHVSAVPASHLQVLNGEQASSAFDHGTKMVFTDVEAELDEEDQHHSVEDSQTTNTRWRNLPKLISRLSNLKELIWSADCPLTRSVIEALQENHKSAILKIFNWSRDDINRGHDDDDELALIDCPNLYSVTANMEVSMNTEYSDMREAAFFRLLASAPNLRHASLVKTLTYSIGSRAPLQFQYNEERRKELFRVDKTSTSLRSLALDGLGAGKQVLDIASRYVDLSKLESFKFTRGRPDKEFFEEAPKRLPNLKEFSLNFMTMDKDRDLVSAANIFIANCDLQMLSLWSWHGIVPFDTILKPSLKTLELHERDMWGRERHLLSLQDLQKIRSTCPDLTNLTFDLQIGGFDGDNPKMYEELSKFPSLKKVEIYFDLGLEGWAVEEALRRMRGEPPLTSKQKANRKSALPTVHRTSSSTDTNPIVLSSLSEQEEPNDQDRDSATPSHHVVNDIRPQGFF